ncbi:hypothetical protein HELRODRAFT_144967, partial [Helobdella robusta]|uniref:H15 domain-containing protein n=1 Tax=Helobdella robusta TaxID=6412 RepID=T1EJH5_HELRO
KSAAAASTKKVVEHPSYNEMVRQALVALKERGGSSRQAILKYLMANFKVGSDEHSVNTHLKVALRNGVKSETLKQSKGSGASGSFRLGAAKDTNKTVAKPKKDVVAIKTKAAASPKKVTKPVEKTSSVKKAVKKPPAAAKKIASPKKPAKIVKKQQAKESRKPKSATTKKQAKPTAAANKKKTSGSKK